jgi:PAS domain S-box-containing protein
MPEETLRKKLKLHELIPYERIEVFLKTIIDSSHDGIWVCDGEGTVLYNNKASEKLTGIRSEEIVGKNVSTCIDMGYWAESVTLRALKQRSQVTVMQDMRLTGKKLLSTSTPVFDREGNIVLVVSNERDITRLTELTEALEQSQKRESKYREELIHIKQIESIREKFVVESEAMLRVIRTALKIAELEETDILLLGESGTGKGQVARLIHDSSSRKDKPFVTINCAALPENLLEAELFGYEKGAFTGARDEGKIGLIELAQGGTLFLDEVGDMPIAIQAKILTYLDDRVITRLGGVKPRQIECSLIAATNKNLESLVEEKTFRQDLYFRLNTFSLEIPPLRKRPEDIFELINFYLAFYNRKYKQQKRLYHSTIEKLLTCPFPGNVRELKNMIKRAVAICDDTHIDDALLKAVRFQNSEETCEEDLEDDAPRGLNERLDSYEKMILKKAMERCKTTREMAAHLGISQPSVIRKLKKAGLTMP